MTQFNGHPQAIESQNTGHATCLCERDAWGRLIWIDDSGTRHLDVHAARAFPINEPDRFVSILDDSGREVAWIEDLSTLAAATRVLIEEDLRLREFRPAITRIVRVSSEITPNEWQVETDRGPTSFTLDAEDDVRRVGPRRVVITDSRKMRYQVADTRALDAASRRLLDRYLL